MMDDERAYVDQQISELCQSLCREAMSLDTINRALLNQAVWGLANGADAEQMPAVLRRLADDMEAGRYKHRTTPERPRPLLTVIRGDRS